MKKRLALLLAITLAALSCAAAAEGNWYVEQGQALALRMQALASDDAYIDLILSSGNEETRQLREGFVQADLSKPSGCWFLPLPDEDTLYMALRRLYAMEGGENEADPFNELTDVGREELMKRLPGTAMSYLSSHAGVAWIMLTSAVNVGKLLEEPEDFTPGYLLLEYPGDYAVLIGYTRSAPGYVGATTTLVSADTRETVESVKDYAELLGLSLELEPLELE